jgi:hypothetical protein
MIINHLSQRLGTNWGLNTEWEFNLCVRIALQFDRLKLV